MRVTPLAALVLVVGMTACEKGSSSPETAGRPEPPPPDGVVATVSSSSLTRALAGLRAYAEGVRPGAGAGIPADPVVFGGLASVIGAGSLDGLDLGQPAHLVILDGPPPVFVLVAKVSDSKRLAASRGAAALDEKDGWAVLGGESGVKAVAGWARAALVPRPVSAQVTAIAYVDRLKAKHAAEIESVRQQMTAAFGQGEPMKMYFDGLLSAVDDVERGVISFDADGERAELDIGLVPRSGSRLAAFAAAQQPSDYALFQKLPASVPDGLVFGGRLAMGPYREGMLALGRKMMGVDGVAYAAWFEKLTALATGEMAGSGSLDAGAMTMVQIYSVTDGPEVDRLLREQLATMSKGLEVDSMGMKMTMTGIPEVGQHGGIAVRATRTTIDLATVPEVSRPMVQRMYGDGLLNRVAVVDKAAVLTVGGDLERIEGAIDALQGKAKSYAPGPEVARMLDDSRRHRESLLLAADFAAFRSLLAPGAPPPAAAGGQMIMGFGVSDGALHTRIGLSAKAASNAFPAAPPR